LQDNALEVAAGRASLDTLYERSLDRLRAQEALAKEPPERFSALIAHWNIENWAAAISDAKYLFGQTSSGEYQANRCLRLESEVWLNQARSRLKRPIGQEEVSLVEISADPEPWGADFKHLAKNLSATLSADPEQLARDKLAAAREAYRQFAGDLAAGKSDLDTVCKWSRRLLEAELAVDDRPANQTAALARYWRRAFAIEDHLRGQYEAGRLSVSDYATIRYVRLDAEIRWAEARARQIQK